MLRCVAQYSAVCCSLMQCVAVCCIDSHHSWTARWSKQFRQSETHCIPKVCTSDSTIAFWISEDLKHLNTQRWTKALLCVSTTNLLLVPLLKFSVRTCCILLQRVAACCGVMTKALPCVLTKILRSSNIAEILGMYGHARAHMRMHIHTHPCTPTNMHKDRHTHTHTHTHTRSHTYILCLRLCLSLSLSLSQFWHYTTMT